MGIPTNVLLSRMLARSRLRQWQLVLEVAALGSVQRAADAVGMSQPAATHALTEVERLFGFSLFERHAKGTRPTPAGEALLPKLRSAMGAFAECAETVSGLLSGSAGELRLGAIGAALGGLLGDAIAEFSRKHAAVAVVVEQKAPGLLLVDVRDGMVDLAVMRRPAQLPTDTAFEDLLSDRYAVVCSPRHPLAGRPGVTLDELARQLWLTPPKSTIAETDFQALWAGTEGPRNLCWVESRAPILMWSLVEQRQALSMIPYNTVRPWLVHGMLAEVPGHWGPTMEPLGMLYPQPLPDPHGPLADLLELLRRHGRLASAPVPVSALGSAPG